MTDAQTGGAMAARTAAIADRPRDRRARPRVPANLPVLITLGASVVVGTTVDASEEGLAVSVPGSTPAIRGTVRVALRLPNRGWHEMEGEVVRRQAGEGGSAVLGIRLPERAAAAAPSTVPATRGRTMQPRPGRSGPSAPARSLGAELRALGSLVYGQAFHDPETRPLPSLVAWAGRLAAGLGLVGCAPATNRELLHMVAALHRRWSAPPAAGAVRPAAAAPSAGRAAARLSGRPLSPRR
ncbi:MAG: PilZ domain [Miltoncostaeaceae bacterium]|nr:PilZ domain [Miltoncostaeaceae bacterium]